MNVFFAIGGGIGDVVWDFLHDKNFLKLYSLVENHGARVRAITQCHCAGAEEIFDYHPHVHEVIAEPWHPPTPEDTRRFNEPDGEWIPLSREDLLYRAGFQQYRMVSPKLYLSREEEHLVARLMSRRPCVCLQPYAGLSDRDACDPASLSRLCGSLLAMNPDVNILVLGKNHERGHKYAEEICDFDHPAVTNLIDKVNIRVAWHLVAHCDAFAGAHSNLIRTAWDHKRRSACIVPEPLLTNHWDALDRKYTYGMQQPEAKRFTYRFAEGGPRRFETLDTDAVARWLMRAEA